MYYNYPIFDQSILPGLTAGWSFIGIIMYVLGSLGLYAMANNTGVKNAWFAWIPIVRNYLLGSLADRRISSLGRKTNFNIWLAVLSGIQTPLAYVSLLLLGIVLASVLYSVPALLTVILLFIMVIGIVSLAYKVVYLIAFYNVMMDYEPFHAALYTVLAFFNLDQLVIFLCRNNVPVGIAGRCEPRQPRYNVHS